MRKLIKPYSNYLRNTYIFSVLLFLIVPILLKSMTSPAFLIYSIGYGTFYLLVLFIIILFAVPPVILFYKYMIKHFGETLSLYLILIILFALVFISKAINLISLSDNQEVMFISEIFGVFIFLWFLFIQNERNIDHRKL